MIYWCLALVVIFDVATSQQIFSNCTTPMRIKSQCIYLTDCEPLTTLITQSSLSPEETQLLRDSQCGYHGKDPLVCCPPRHDVLPNPGQCGVSLVNRIHGGNETKIDDYPWMALLEYTKPDNTKGFQCGGALINHRYILTAAHCTKGELIDGGTVLSGVRLGEWDLSSGVDCVRDDCNDLPLDVPVEKVITHEDYNPSSKNQLHDIALLRLARDVPYTNWIKSICLPKASHLRDSNFANITTTVSGWGRTETGRTSNLKLQAIVECVSLEQCNRVYSTFNVELTDRQLCAGGKKGIDSCSGDSGGPLMAVDSTAQLPYFFAAGIVSFGPRPCALKGWPGVYTKVGKYVDWIESKLEV